MSTSNEMRVFEGGATRQSDEGKLHYKGFLSPRALRKYAEYMESHRVQADGNTRDPDNWKKGIPLDAYEDSFIRHVFEWWELIEVGNREEAKEITPALFFNIQGWMHEMEKR